MNRLRPGPKIWLTTSASTMGAMNPNTSVVKLITNVLRMSCQNRGLSKNWTKYLNPTQSPPVRPAWKSNSRKASWMPYIGT